MRKSLPAAFFAVLPALLLALLCASLPACAQQPGALPGRNLLPDPSIEETQPPNQFGVPFKQWGGYKFEGDVAFDVGKVARTGNSSAEMIGAPNGKIRLYSPPVTVGPGRYRFTCYLRGLDIGTHPWGLSEDISFADDHYYPLKKTGTFGWTRLDLVKDVAAPGEVVARIGLWAPGRLWVDDASVVQVPATTPLTDGPVLGQEEAPVAPPGPLNRAPAVHCPDCGYLNMPAWKRCYACDAPLDQAAAPVGPPVRLLTSFEEGAPNPFSGGTASSEHATEGHRSLRLEKDYAAWDGPQDWTGYDFLKADIFNAGDEPRPISVEIQDQETRDYWTRVNYNTVAPPGASTLIVPTDIRVGEKSRPGRPLDKARVRRLVLAVDGDGQPVYFDCLRLERDLSDSVKVPGLKAYDFGPAGSPPFRGFTPVTPATLYSPGRSYGLKNAQIWNAFDVLQPDPLYETFICIQSGGFAVDLPDGKYHVWVNTDSPSGFWGDYQKYRVRSIKANGVLVSRDTMDLASFKKKYYRFADSDDSPQDNTFDKYQRVYFQPKEFDVTVTNGQLYLEFLGEGWAQSVSALVIYPAAESALGQKYLRNLQERRRFYFDNYFKRVLPNPHRDANGVVPDLKPTAAETKKGYVLFSRDWMQDTAVNAIPRRSEVTPVVSTFASAGTLEPVVFSVYPLRPRGTVRVSATDLVSSAGVIPAADVTAGVVSHRLTRVTAEGTVYTIAPRFIMPRDSAPIRPGVTTTFWMTLHTPAKVKAGIYTGKILLRFADGAADSLKLRVRIFATPLDEMDAAAGPFGSTISLPWYDEDLVDYNRTMFRKCLARLREYGCTTFTGIPSLSITGWSNGKPTIDFRQADEQMADARAAGFKDVVENYNGGIGGFDNYHIDETAMKAAGFTSYVDFLRPILTAVDEHAHAAGWLPVAYNLCDEPLEADRPAATANALAWREAAPADLITTGATSMTSPKPGDTELALASALKVPSLNLHDEAAVQALHDAGDGWAFYNGGSRWTFGTYMFKCAHQYGMKFRVSWHFNAAAGDPYYALDCREDDYSWLVTNARMDLIPSIFFDREIREGITDYRTLQTLARLINQKPENPESAAAAKLIADKMSSFKLGDRDSPTPAAFRAFRLQLDEAIELLQR